MVLVVKGIAGINPVGESPPKKMGFPIGDVAQASCLLSDSAGWKPALHLGDVAQASCLLSNRRMEKLRERTLLARLRVMRPKKDMEKEFHQWYSHRVELEMPIAVYGHYGLPVLAFPTASADCEEYERFLLVAALGELLDSGRIKLFSINSINRYTWGNRDWETARKAYLTQMYDEYVIREVVPFIDAHCHGRQPIVVTGASMGAYYAANSFFKHPDVIGGIIGMSGVYNLADYYDDYWDMNCYFNNPVAFIPNMNDDYHLPLLRSKRHIHILSSYGMWENPEKSKELSQVLAAKGIQHNLDMWDHHWPHDWPTWRKMLPLYLDGITRQGW